MSMTEVTYSFQFSSFDVSFLLFDTMVTLLPLYILKQRKNGLFIPVFSGGMLVIG